MKFLSIFPLAGFLFIAAALAGRILVLRKKGIRVSSKAAGKPRHLVLLYPFFGALLVVWLSELVRLAFGLTSGFLPDWFTGELSAGILLKILGAVVLVAALIVLMLALLHFHDSLRFGLDEKNQGQLITRGIFSFSRNPFFLSIILYFSGLALLHPSLFFILMALLTVTSIHFFILKEEKFLLKFYGEAYRKYKKKVGRYF
ncbi:MAG TPA: isoprenylcysteine carboxylmethyltransferase family protein [Mariniphaga anaerophila]|uniref:Isoprenylcysteine carboxylmethyltransferase family protein n=1 Tax=Mariniphaga anaerophila TaxID=1484053 RepID=A0A831PJH1_9BACT|nr:isoprenylcysteine carboxylmethyltransferase family protein [Mariniphaga anaerophila]